MGVLTIFHAGFPILTNDCHLWHICSGARIRDYLRKRGKMLIFASNFNHYHLKQFIND